MTDLYTFKQTDLDDIANKSCTASIDGVDIVVGQVWTDNDNIIITPDSGFTVESGRVGGYFGGKYKYTNGVINSNNTMRFSGGAIYGVTGQATSLTWQIVTEVFVPDVVYTFKQDDLDYWALTQGVGYLDGVVVSVGDIWYNNAVLTVESPEGWVYASGKVSGYFAGKYKSVDGVINPINVLTFDGSLFTSITNPANSLFWDIVGTQTTPDVVGANSLYKVTSANISEIMNNRLQWVTIDVERNSTSVDFGNYILGLIQLPWGLSEEFILNDEVINLLSWNTGVTAPKLLDDSYTYDLGEIDLSDKAVTNNYTNSKIVLNLPRSEPLELEPDVVLGYVLKIVYVVSLYDGTTTINIIRGDTILYSKTVDLGVNIPYGASFHTAIHSLDNSDVNLGVENGILTPFIEIYTGSDLSQLESIFSTPITATELISAQDGYFYVENVDLNFKCSSGEREEIKNILMNGVFNNA